MINKEKIKFWDRIFKTMIICFVISIASVFIVPENTLDNNLFVYPWLILFFVAIVSEIVFTIGMAYHSYKLKRYGWMIVVILLGTIFPIIFYFSILKKEVKEEKKKKLNKLKKKN